MERPVVRPVVRYHVQMAIMWKIVLVSKMPQHRAMKTNTFPTAYVMIVQIHIHIPTVEYMVLVIAIEVAPPVMLIIPQT